MTFRIGSTYVHLFHYDSLPGRQDARITMAKGRKMALILKEIAPRTKKIGQGMLLLIIYLMKILL
ncbi:MAG: hypothetical protein NT166_15330, partial [Candidatus Aminicenantes bacterium]|nr:hypothetical protein [Candidatus Aminicenantes bacterium]